MPLTAPISSGALHETLFKNNISHFSISEACELIKWWMSVSRRCSHGKQVAGGSHADSAEFSKVEGESKSLHAPQVWVSKRLVCPTTAYQAP